jgi:branched-chain amino acid transport system ATP-binding protein
LGGLGDSHSLSFAAPRAHSPALSGPNGAGKTTVFNCITGFYRPTSGEIRARHADGRVYPLHAMPGHRICEVANVARTFQNIRLFAGMSLLENLLVAQHTKLMRASGYTIGGLLGLPSFARAERAAVEFAKHWLDRVGLLHRADDAAGDLPYGDQRRLEIARAMCTRPTLLCLDEPAAGLNPRESRELNQLLLSMRGENGLSILLIEHDMGVVMEISDRIVVLDYGKKIAEGKPEEIRSNPAVIAAYLGVEDEEVEQVEKEIRA